MPITVVGNTRSNGRIPYWAHKIAPRTLNDKKQPTFNIQKHNMWKQNNHSQTLTPETPSMDK